jgi:dolichyl-phosphate beta-glucosyltransferase
MGPMALPETGPGSDRPLVSIVIPAFDEERRLPDTLAQILAYLERQPYRSEVVVADDGSTDGTAALVEAVTAERPEVRLLRLAHRGKGCAVRAGALAARGEYVLLCDADLATPIEAWDTFRRELDRGYALVIGSREGLGARRLDEPAYRHLMGRAFNLVVRAIAVGGIEDTQCGFKALRRTAAVDLFRQVRLYDDEAPLVRGPAVTAYDVELLYLARRRGYPIAQVPVLWRYGDDSKVSPLRDSLRNLRDVLTVRWHALRGHYHQLDAPLPFGAQRAAAPRG